MRGFEGCQCFHSASQSRSRQGKSNFWHFPESARDRRKKWGGKAGADTLPLSTEVWKLAFMGWEAGWEGSEMGRESKAPGKSLSPADGRHDRPSPSRRSRWGERQWVAEEAGRLLRGTCVLCAWQAAGSAQLPPKS